METPLVKAAKRGEVFCGDPMTTAVPLHTPSFSRYRRQIVPDSAREPAKASPKPSRMDFFPNSMTFPGIWPYWVSTTNLPTYSVSPVTLGKSARGRAPSPVAEAASAEEATAPREALPKSRRSIFHPGHSDHA